VRARVLLLAATLSCGGLEPPARVAEDAAGLEQARATLAEAAARRGDLRLVEGGLVLHAMVYESRESLLWQPTPVPGTGPMLDPRDHYVVTDEVLVGPREVYVPISGLRTVWVRSWAREHGVELELDGEPRRVVLLAEREEAERLAGAIESLRRSADGPPR
jgi:hypothetical protein